MRLIFPFVVSLLIAAARFSQAQTSTEYSASEAAKHVGETVIITGKVDDVHKAKGGNIFINMGGAHPNHAFTAFIPSTYAEEFPNAKDYFGAVVSVSGKIETHKGKPQIVISSADQITVKTPSEKAKTSPSVSP